MAGVAVFRAWCFASAWVDEIQGAVGGRNVLAWRVAVIEKDHRQVAAIHFSVQVEIGEGIEPQIRSGNNSPVAEPQSGFCIWSGREFLGFYSPIAPRAKKHGVFI